jgi:hypothetical protein
MSDRREHTIRGLGIGLFLAALMLMWAGSIVLRHQVEAPTALSAPICMSPQELREFVNTEKTTVTLLCRKPESDELITFQAFVPVNGGVRFCANPEWICDGIPLTH